MKLRRISILNYKNIAEAELEFSDKMNCLIGMNGEGKTNLLDAIYFLSLCRSSNVGQDSMAMRHGEDMMSLQAQYVREDGSAEEIHIGMKRGQKKTVRRSRKPYRRLSEHIGVIPLVMVSPEDQGLIAGGSEERRKFVDLVISQYDIRYIESLARYNKALMQRNALLKTEEEPDNDLMLMWEEQMNTEAAYIYDMRQKFVDEFIPVFQEYHSCISERREKVGLEYVSHIQRGPLLGQLTQFRAKERIVGYSLHGIHKDDLKMTLGTFPVKREGSQGQNKTFLTAMKLAQYDFLKRTGSHTAPLLLLDDIFDKLDASRVQQIVKLVSGDNFGQIFITDTNRGHIDQILTASTGDYRIFSVQGGHVAPI